MSTTKYKLGYAIGFAFALTPSVVIAIGAYELGKSNGRIEAWTKINAVLKEQLANIDAQKN